MSDLPNAFAEAEIWNHRLRPQGPSILSPEATLRRTRSIFAMWFCLLLEARGWECEVQPGLPAMFHKDQQTIQPFDVIDQLADGALENGEWRSLCTKYGI